MTENLYKPESLWRDEKLLAQRSYSKLQDHFLLAVRGCMFNVFAATSTARSRLQEDDWLFIQIKLFKSRISEFWRHVGLW